MTLALLKQLFHLIKLLRILTQYVIVLVLEKSLDRVPGSDVLELAQQVEGRFSGIQLSREGVSDEQNDLAFNLADAVLESLELSLPSLSVGLEEHITWETLKFPNLLLN